MTVAKLGLLLLAALLTCTVAVLGDEGTTDVSADTADDCQGWFGLQQDPLQICQEDLFKMSAKLEDEAWEDPAVLNASACPASCRVPFQMPAVCGGYIETSMAQWGAVAPKWEAGTFTVCDSLLCTTQQCSINVAAIAALRGFFALLDPGNGVWVRDGGWNANATVPPPAPSSNSSTSVGVIVGAVIAGNVLFVSGLALVMTVRRRRRQRRLQQAQVGSTHHSDLDGSECCGTAVTASVEEGLADSAQRGGMLKPEGTRKGVVVLATAAQPIGRPGEVASSSAQQAHGGATAGATTGGGSDLVGQCPPSLPHEGQEDSQATAALWAGALGAAAMAWGAAASMGAAAQLGSEAAASSQATDSSVASQAEFDASKADGMQQDELELMGLPNSAAPTPMAADSRAKFLPSYGTSSYLGSAGAGAGSGSTSGAEQPLGSIPEQQQADTQPQPPQQQQQQELVPGKGSGQVVQQGVPGVSRAPSSLATTTPRSSGSQALVDLEPWRIRYDSLALQRRLGEGSFGTVHLAKWNETLVAVKLLTAGEGDGTDPATSSARAYPHEPLSEALEKEAGLMASLRHPNVTMFIGVCAEPPALVTEYCSRGSLLDVMRAARVSQSAASALTWVRRLSMALDAAKGMLCLHAHVPPIIHRDLKSPNLLVDAAWRVKVADFNLSKLMDLEGIQSSTKHGLLNPRWLAPEVLLGLPATAASDVFSMGVVMWEMLTWSLPWEEEGRNAFQLLHMITHGERLKVPARQDVPGPDKLSEAEYGRYVVLMQRCWAQEAADRPSFAEVIVELRGIMAHAVGIGLAE